MNCLVQEPEFLESLGSNLSRKSECFVYAFNLKIEVIILLKEVQKSYQSKNQMIDWLVWGLRF